MDSQALRKLFEQVRKKRLSPDEAVERLRHLPFEDLGFAKVDHHRALRTGMPEVIFGENKTPKQVADIFFRLAKHGGNVLATRANEEQFAAVKKRVRAAQYRKLARAITLQHDPKKYGKGRIAVVSAGTSDIPVAEEAVAPREAMGNDVPNFYHVGVPVIAVPTSVGYGAAFKGLAALLGMMNSCASNVSVVNIDNGFGAGYVASLINRL